MRVAFRKRCQLYVVFVALLCLVGCQGQSEPATGKAGGQPGKVPPPVDPSADGARYILNEAPADPLEVIDARAAAEDGEPVVLVGRIGGSKNPWIEGRAMFTLVDRSLLSCEQIPGDTCPEPWDYCCQTDKLPAAMVLVKVVDESGDPIATDARDLLGVRELTEVVVHGTAQKDATGSLVVLADGLFVKR